MTDYNTEHSSNLNISGLFDQNEDGISYSEFDNISLNEISDIFAGNRNDSQYEENESENSKIYFTQRFLKKIEKKKLETKIPLKKINLFNITKENGKKLNKKRGRPTEDINSTKENANQKIHDKFSTDNILRKIQVHYMTFIISSSNDILKSFNYQEKFYKLDYNVKKIVNKDYFESLKKKTLLQIICKNISKKYKDKGDNINEQIYEKIKENKVLKNFFNENYITFFKEVYYKSDKIINFKKYGLDRAITLSNDVKMFKDLLANNRDDAGNNKEYIENINLCVSQNYIPENKFLTN